MKAYLLSALIALLAASVHQGQQQPRTAPSPYLFVWAGDSDGKDSDFLAVIDARPGAASYGEIVATLPVGATATFPHHTEYEFPANAQLFANGWGAGQTFIIDLRDPRKPKLVNQFKDVAEYGFPHSYARLPTGNVLATLQVKKIGFEPPGALIELDTRGNLIRSSGADVAGMDKKQLWPYSLLALPKMDRVVTTNTEMGLPKWAQAKGHGSSHETHTLSDSNNVQVWRLSDLRLLSTVMIPAAARGKSNLNPAEPRLLPDGSVYVNTFNCGLFRLTGLESSTPKAEHVFDFPGAGTKDECGVPVVVGKYWIQTDPSLPGLIVLNTSNPAKPVEVSRLLFDERFKKPHWVAADRSMNRVVVTGNNQSWILIANIDMATGKLSLDQKLNMNGGDHLGVDFNRTSWPHGATGKAFVHGALFGPMKK